MTEEVVDGRQGAAVRCHFVQTADRDAGGGSWRSMTATGQQLPATTKRDEKGRDVLSNGNTW